MSTSEQRNRDCLLSSYNLSNGRTTNLGDGIRIPLQSFCGTMGVARAEPGEHFVLPPGNFGGYVDIRHRNAGAGSVGPRDRGSDLTTWWQGRESNPRHGAYEALGRGGQGTRGCPSAVGAGALPIR